VPHGEDWREVTWTTPSYQQILEMLRNPAYAGIYVRGKRKTATVLNEHGDAQKKRQRLCREQWDVFLEDHHEPYISQETWERNMEKIAANAHLGHAPGKGSPQNGNGLMSGLLRCRRCGHKLHANYRASGVSYVCRGGATQRDARGASCFSFLAKHIEEQLVELVLEVLTPAGIAAAEHAAERLAVIHHQERQIIVDRVEAVREVEARAAREYKKTDATYTTVRQRLAQEWEQALSAVQRVEEQLKRFDKNRPCLPTSAQRQTLIELGKSVRRVWYHPNADMVLKKQIVRTLIEEIVVDREKPTNEIVLIIHWAGGYHTELRAPTHWKKRRRAAGDVKSVVRTLRKVLTDDDIAVVLNREKIRDEAGATWTSQRVAEFRERHQIPAFCQEIKERHGWMTQADAATCLEISPMSMTRLVQSGIVPAEQPRCGLPSVIKRETLDTSAVKRAVSQLKSASNRPLPLDPNQLNLFENKDY
jgi:hypothetical protein